MPETLRCPRDRTDLVVETSAGFRLDRCPRCSGVVAMAAMLRRIAPRKRVLSLWNGLGRGTPGDPCPSCANPLDATRVGAGASAIDLDACRTCQLIWFDADELARFSPEPQRPQDRTSPEFDGLSLAACEALAKAKIETKARGEQARQQAYTAFAVLQIIMIFARMLRYLGR